MSLNHQNFAISTFPIIHFVCMFLAPQPRKQLCISIVFIFYQIVCVCWGARNTQTNCIMGYVEITNYSF